MTFGGSLHAQDYINQLLRHGLSCLFVNIASLHVAFQRHRLYLVVILQQETENAAKDVRNLQQSEPFVLVTAYLLMT